MKVVNVGQFRKGLRSYLAEVKKGESVLIKNRDSAIAKLVPANYGEDISGEVMGLIEAGILKPAEVIGGTPRSFYRMAKTRSVQVDIGGSIRKERDER